jgi:putative transposase
MKDALTPVRLLRYHSLRIPWESGYDAWRKRPICQRKREDAHLTAHIQQVFVSRRGVYGSPRMHVELKEQGWRCSRKRIARLMQEHGMSAKRKRRHPITTKSHPGHAVAPNLLQQDFTAERPNQKWTGDITSIPTAEGWLYLAVILDLYSRMVVGWSMSAHCDEPLVEAALRMALARRCLAGELLHHTDRGSQYTSHAYRQALEHARIVVSMSGKGNCYDNAVTESFFGSLKDECVHRTSYRSHEEARQSLFEFLEVFYNRQRRHSSLDYLSPLAFEQRWQVTAENPAVFLPD